MLSAPLVDLQGVQDFGSVKITPLRNAMLFIKYLEGAKGEISIWLLGLFSMV